MNSQTFFLFVWFMIQSDFSSFCSSLPSPHADKVENAISESTNTHTQHKYIVRNINFDENFFSRKAFSSPLTFFMVWRKHLRRVGREKLLFCHKFISICVETVVLEWFRVFDWPIFSFKFCSLFFCSKNFRRSLKGEQR